MKKMIALIAAVASLNVAAYETRFDFDVYSDLGDMWVCGVSLQEGSKRKYRGGDFFYAEIDGKPRTVSSDQRDNNGLATLGIQSNDFNFSSDNKKEITNLHIGLGSEKFGSTYSVTLCWEAAWFAVGEGPATSAYAKYKTSTLAKIKNNYNDSYAKDSDLRNKTRWQCQRAKSNYTVKQTNTSFETNVLASHDYKVLRKNNSNSKAKNEKTTNKLTKCTLTYTFKEYSNSLREHNQHVTIKTLTKLYRKN
jgi:hypothetical protein